MAAARLRSAVLAWRVAPRRARPRRRAGRWPSAPPGWRRASGGCSSACTATAGCRPGWRCWRCWRWRPCWRCTWRWRWRCSRAGAAAGRWRDALLFAACWLLAELARGAALHRLSLGRRGLRACRRPAGRLGAVGRRVRHRRAGGLAGRAAGAAAATASRGAALRGIGCRWRCSPALGAASAPRDFTQPTGTLRGDAAAGQRSAGREVRPARSSAAGAGLDGAAAAARRAATWWWRRRRPSRCCRSRLPDGLLGGAARALSQGRRPAALIGVPLGNDDRRATPTRCVGLAAGAAAASTATTSTTWCPSASSSRRGFRWFTELMNIPLGDFNRGAAGSAVVRGQGRARGAATSATKTCSARNWPRASPTRPRAPTMLANISNIGWFGDTIAVDQHLQISRMRALEFAAADAARHQHRRHGGHRPPRRASRTALPPHTRGVLDGEVQGRDGITPFACWAGALRAVAAVRWLALAAGAGSLRCGAHGAGPVKSRFARRSSAVRAPARHAHLPANHPATAVLLGRAGLRAAAALRHGSRRRHQPHRDLPARARPRALEGRLRAAQPPAQGRPLRREPEPPAALLPVPGGAEARAGQHPGAVPRLARSAGLRPEGQRHPLRRGRLGEPDAGRLGPGLGGLAQRHGGHAVHLLPAGRRHRLQADHRRDHLRPGAPGDVPAGRGQRLRPAVDRQA